MICPTCSAPFSNAAKYNRHVRRHDAQPFEVNILPPPALPEPPIGADVIGAPTPPVADANPPPGGPAHLVGAAGDGQGPEILFESPNLVVTDMELPTFDLQLKLPEFDFGLL